MSQPVDAADRADTAEPREAGPAWERWALVAVVVSGAVLRVVAHRGVTYSPADEQVYATTACTVSERGLGAYPGLVHDYLTSPDAYLYPSPGRWSFTLANAAAMKVTGSCDRSVIAWLATVAGVAMLVVVALAVRRIFDDRIAIVATLFVATSPLQLHLGRRALNDELLGVLCIAALWAVVGYLERRTWARIASVVALVTLAFGTKEIVFLIYPALFLPVLLAWVRERKVVVRDLLLGILPPLVALAVFGLLAHDIGAYADVLHDVARSVDSPYQTTVMRGDPQRLLIDLVALSPIVTLLAVAGLGLLPGRGERRSHVLAACAVAALVPYAVVASKNVRFVVAGETLLCVLAAWALVTLAQRGARWWLPLVALGAAAVNLVVFYQVSVRAGVYDPVTVEILRALHVVP